MSPRANVWYDLSPALDMLSNRRISQTARFRQLSA